MSMRYLLKETADGFRRAWGSCLLSILTIAFFLTLLGLLALVSANIAHFQRTLNDNLQVQAFLSNGLEERQITALSQRIGRLAGVAQVTYISRQAAAAEFQKEFGQDLFTMLEENPLPPSLVIRLTPPASDETRIGQIIDRIKEEPGVDEVVYHLETLMTLRRYADIAGTFTWILLVFVTLGSLFVVSNNIRLVISARKQIIRTMRLVGATASFIRSPLILEGTLQGVAGAGISAAMLYLVSGFVARLAPSLIQPPPGSLLVLLALGSMLGFFGSLLAIKRYL